MEDHTLYYSVLHSLENYRDRLQQIGMKDQAESVNEKLSQYRKGLFQVSVIGGYCVGKTTLVNALLYKKLLRTSVIPNTLLPTKIVDGKNSDFVAIKNSDPSMPDCMIRYDQIEEKIQSLGEDNNGVGASSYLEIETKMQTPKVNYIDFPGLEQESEKTSWEEIIGQSDAVVMVLSAVQIGKSVEKQYIQSHFSHRCPKNVFFVVNKVNQLPNNILPAQIQNILRNLLNDVFTDESGKFDMELYNQRVFFVDAYTSECARTNQMKGSRVGMKFIKTPVALNEDQSTGVPEFEHALLGYIDTLEKEREIFRSYFPTLNKYYAMAERIVVNAGAICRMNPEQIHQEIEGKHEAIEHAAMIIDMIKHEFDYTMNDIYMNARVGYGDFGRSISANWEPYFENKNIPWTMRDSLMLVSLRNQYSTGLFRHEENIQDRITETYEYSHVIPPLLNIVREYLELESRKITEKIKFLNQNEMERLEARVDYYLESIIGTDVESILLDLCGISTCDTRTLAVQIILSLLGIEYYGASQGLISGNYNWGDVIANEMKLENMISPFYISATGFVAINERQCQEELIYVVMERRIPNNSEGKTIIFNSKRAFSYTEEKLCYQKIEKLQKAFQSITENSSTLCANLRNALKEYWKELNECIAARNREDAIHELEQRRFIKDELKDTLDELASLIR